MMTSLATNAVRMLCAHSLFVFGDWHLRYLLYSGRNFADPSFIDPALSSRVV